MSVLRRSSSRRWTSISLALNATLTNAARASVALVASLLEGLTAMLGQLAHHFGDNLQLENAQGPHRLIHPLALSQFGARQISRSVDHRTPSGSTYRAPASYRLVSSSITSAPPVEGT